MGHPQPLVARHTRSPSSAPVAVLTAQQTLADAQAFYADLKARARRLGRDPEQGAADGFNVMPAALPAGLKHFVPLLRKRGLFREDYTATTLRGRYGIPRPVSQYALSQRPGAGE